MPTELPAATRDFLRSLQNDNTCTWHCPGCGADHDMMSYPRVLSQIKACYEVRTYLASTNTRPAPPDSELPPLQLSGAFCRRCNVPLSSVGPGGAACFGLPRYAQMNGDTYCYTCLCILDNSYVWLERWGPAETTADSTITEGTAMPHTAISYGDDEIGYAGECHECGELVEEGYEYFHRDRLVCETCYSALESVVIQEYGSRDYPTPKPATRRGALLRNTFYLGVELEVECEGNAVHKAELIHRKFPNALLLKEDGSIDNGFEMVSGPMDLKHHRKFWAPILDYARGIGLRSWSYTSTGLHVHISRRQLSRLDEIKLAVFVNSLSTRRYVVGLAGRESPNFAALRRKKLNGSATCGAHYEAVNFGNDRTIEFRLFKGTLHTEHVLACIEFCHAVVYWTKETSLHNITKWSHFWKFVGVHRKTYSNLFSYYDAKQAVVRKTIHARKRDILGRRANPEIVMDFFQQHSALQESERAAMAQA